MQNNYQNIAQEIWQSWLRVTTQPKVETFEQEIPRASMEKTIISMAAAGVIAGLLSAIQVMVILAGVPFLGAMAGVGALFGVIWTPIAAVIGLFIFSAIVHIIARLVSGRPIDFGPDFLTLTYLLSMIGAPLYVVNALLGLVFAFARVPFLGGLVGLAVFVYSIYLLILALRAMKAIPSGTGSN